MKKIIYAFLLVAFLTSCASHPGRVCGGSGGGRVVENTQMQKPIYNLSVV
ncbi:lipoprotein [Flavobacterium sp.]|nr:lipoprotein [Flavobacterium sp.]